MPNNSANTGSAGRLRIVVTEEAVSAVGNWSDIDWALYLDERVSSPTSWSAGGLDARVSIAGDGTIWSGSYGFDWRPSGLQTELIASGTYRVYHNPDGNRNISVTGHIDATGLSGPGGPTDVVLAMSLTTLKVTPGAPTGVTATRVSDTQATVSWAQTSASNGQPTSNIIQKKINGGAWVTVATISPTTSATVAVAPNQKSEFRVAASNSAGTTGYVAAAAAVFTTPADPTGAVAAKNASLDIVIDFTNNVAYTEHTHEVWHGTVAGGVTTWDGAALATLASGVATYTHVAPSAALVHIYRVRARAGALASGYSTTSSVAVLAAPNKPTFQALPAFADKAAALAVGWVHNPVDTTPQTAYEFGYSTNGGAAWSTTGKVVSTVSSKSFAANAYAANVVLTMRVRTWGSATTGGADGTGASAWADLASITFKTIPVTTIPTPANASTVTDSTLHVTLGFTQAEGATFVQAQLELLQGATLLEELSSSISVGITMATVLQNGVSYTVRARSLDSNGIWSAWATSTFGVTYLAPVTPGVDVAYLPDTGFGQIDITIAAPGGGEAAASTVTITRTIDGVTETVVEGYPAAAALTFLDTTPVIRGTNTYAITTVSALGARTTVTEVMVTTECRRAFLSKGAGYGTVGAFGGNLEVSETLSVASDTVEAAGRTKPIGLYGVETSVKLKVSSFIFEDFGSTIDEMRAILLTPGKACYRDTSGRRVFGTVEGSVGYKKTNRADLSFTMIETS